MVLFLFQFVIVVLIGATRSEYLTLTLVHSQATLNVPADNLQTVSLAQLNIFNATFNLANDLAIASSSYFFEVSLFRTL
jgi:hypothetical protein